MQDLQNLRDKAIEALRRDLNHIFLEVSGGKLSPTSSRDLVAYYKLLTEINAEEKNKEERTEEYLEGRTKEELEEMAKKLLSKG